MDSRSILVGDPHITLANLERGALFLGKLLDIVREIEPISVVILGDLFDTKAIIRSEVLGLWTRYLKEAVKYSRHILLVGNHDLVSLDSKDSALAPFSEWENVTVIDRPALDPGGVSFVPYLPDAQTFAATVRGGSGVLLCHQSFDGAQFQNGFYDPHGVSLECVSSYDGVISGHIHKQQKFGNVWYTGTPYQQEPEDSGERKRIWLVDLGQIRIPDGLSDTEMVRPIDLGMPEYIRRKFDGIEEVSAWIASAVPGNIYDIDVRASSDEIDAFYKQEAVKNIRKAIDLSLNPVYDPAMTPVGSLRISEKLTCQQMVSEYIEKKYSDGPFDGAKLTEVCLRILEKTSG